MLGWGIVLLLFCARNTVLLLCEHGAVYSDSYRRRDSVYERQKYILRSSTRHGAMRGGRRVEI